MQGLHLTADLRCCPVQPLLFTDAAALRACCLQAVSAAGLTPVGELFHRFTVDAGAGAGADAGAGVDGGGGGGVTGVVLLAESHLAVHTWPELAAVTLDVYVCNFSGDNSARAHALLAALEAAFAPGEVCRQQLQRGQVGITAPTAA